MQHKANLGKLEKLYRLFQNTESGASRGKKYARARFRTEY